MAKIRIMIADDHPVVREGLVKILGSVDECEIVGQASDGNEAIRLAKKLRPDVVIIDLQMPKLDGVEAIQEIVRRVPTTNVVILTNFDQDEYIYRGIQAGAIGYVLKDSSVDDLLEVIRTAARGESLLSTHIATKLVEHISTPKKKYPITDREIQVLQCLVKGLRNKEIAEQLHISERTVKSHVNNIFAKLNVKSRTAAVSMAIKENIVEFE